MKIAKSLILSTLALGMTVGAYATFAAPEQESKVIAVSKSTGTLEAKSTTTWTSNEENPKLTVNLQFYADFDYSGALAIYGTGGGTLTTDEGWYVSEISLNPYGDTDGSIKIGETTFTPTMGSDVYSVTFTQDETPTIEVVSKGTGLYFKNINVTVSKVQEVVEPDPEPVVTVPAEGKYYRLLTRFNGAQSQARYGSCIELLRDAADKGNNAQADRLWSNAPAEEGADNYDYQWFTFEADPAGTGYYALVCKAKPNGSVNSVPSVSTNSNTARWDYDNEAKHYGFYLVSEVNGKTTQGTDEAGFYSSITSKDAASGWYMNTSAAGQGFSVHLFSDPTDQNAGLYTFEPMPESEVVDPVDPDTKEFKVLCELGTFARYDGVTTSSSVASWTSNATEPQLHIKAIYVNKTDYINNMTKADEGDIEYYSVNNKSKDPSKLVFELDDEAWYVSGFSFNAISTTSGINITVGEDVYNPTSEGVLVSGTFTEEGPAEVQFSGEFGPTTLNNFVVTIAKVKEEGGEEPEPVDEPVVVYNAKGTWSINTFCCEEPTGEGAPNGLMTSLIDNNPDTYYHSQYQASKYDGRHGFILDLGKTTNVAGLAWLSRRHAAATNGLWRHYSAWFFNSADELPELADHAAYESYLTSNTPGAEAALTAAQNAPVETSMFDAPVDTRYILIVVQGNADFSCAAELGIVQLTSAIRAEAIADLEGYGKLLPGADELVESAIDVVKEADNESVVEIAAAAIAGVKEGLNAILESFIADGNYLTITNVRRGEYLASKAVEAAEATETTAATEAFMGANTLAAAEPDAVWTLVRKSTSTETEAADEATDDVDNTFVLRNEKLGEAGYLCYVPSTSTTNMCLGEYESAYHFTAEFTPNGIAFLFGNNDLGLNINSYGGNLTWYDYTDAGSMWTIGTLPTCEYDEEEGDIVITWGGATYFEGWAYSYSNDAITSFSVTLPEGVKPTGLGTCTVSSDSSDEETLIEGITASDLVYDEENGTWTYTLPEPYTTSAYYWVEFDANFFSATAEDGTVSYLPALDFYDIYFVQLNYSPNTELPLVVTPAEGDVTELSEIRLSIDDPYYDLNFTKSETITLSKDGEEVATYASEDLLPAEDYSYFYWTLPQTYTEAGTYTLTVPAQILMGVNGRNAAATVTWTIAEQQSGITDVTVEGKAAKVYDLQGRRVVRPVRGSVNIVDGKKTIVRK